MSDKAEALAELAEEQYCYLTTTGRVSGLPREIEIWFGVRDSTIYMLSGGRDRSNWVRNLMKNPAVTVRIAGETFSGNARALTERNDEDAAGRRMLFAKYAPGYDGSLDDWAETALPVAIDVE